VIVLRNVLLAKIAVPTGMVLTKPLDEAEASFILCSAVTASLGNIASDYSLVFSLGEKIRSRQRYCCLHSVLVGNKLFEKTNLLQFDATHHLRAEVDDRCCLVVNRN
jgi:hypothetical protein